MVAKLNMKHLNQPKFFTKDSKSGFALVTVLVILIIITTVGILFISIISHEMKINNNFKNSTRAFYLAEAGIEKAAWEMNRSGGSYSGENNTILGDGKFTVTVEVDPSDSNKRIITSEGFYPKNVTFPAKRKISLTLTTDSSQTVSFHYAVQVGSLGLTMNSNATVNGNIYSNANIVGTSNSRINGDAYAVTTISSPAPTVTGSKNPNSPAQALPNVDINYWKDQANINNDPYVGDYQVDSGSQTLGPKKIQGNFTINSNATLTLTGPLYVTGNFSFDSNGKLFLDQSFGSKGTVIVVDGLVRVNSNAQIRPTTASPKGYIMTVSTNTSLTAIEINSNAAGGIFYAFDGGIVINANGHAVSVVGKKLTLNSNAVLDYDIGLVSTVFTSGPGGIWIEESSTWNEIY